MAGLIRFFDEEQEAVQTFRSNRLRFSEAAPALH
jgi:hypothetical protein